MCVCWGPGFHDAWVLEDVSAGGRLEGMQDLAV